MLIIKINSGDGKFHHFQSQSHRTECWLDGYTAVPKELENIVYDCMGYCDLVIENDVLTGITPHPELIPKPSAPEPTAEELINAFLGVTSYE